MRAWLTVLSVLCVAACSDPVVQELPAAKSPRRALWVLAEGSYRPLEDPVRVEQLVLDAARLGTTDLFVQVYRGGRSWFPSEHADETPFREIVASNGGPTLPTLLALAHASGIRVHGWFNVLSLAQNSDAPLVQRIGHEAVLVDREGRSLLDYPQFDVPLPDRLRVRLGTPGVWLDPAVPGVIEYLERTLDDLVHAAPELDGLHLDFIRHPIALPYAPGSRFAKGLDFGYAETTKGRFEEQTGQPFRRGDAWDDFRRDRVNEVVQRLRLRLPETWQLSAAVLPWADRAYLVAMQDWRRWLDEGWLDFAVAMAYTRDDRLLGYLARDLTTGVGGARVWLGLGTWLFLNDAEQLKNQIRIAREAAPAGVALFSYDALTGKPESMEWIEWSGS